MPHANASEMYETHRDKLVGYASGILGSRHWAEDIVQEAFIRFSRASLEVRKERPEAYLYRVVRNLALDRQRRSNLEEKIFAGEEAECSAAETKGVDPCTAMIHRE